MPSLQNLSLILIGIVGSGVAGTAGVYVATLTTIEEYLKEDLLDESSNNDWKEIQKKLNGHQNMGQYKGLGLEEIKNQGDLSDGSAIKEWCAKVRKESINPKFMWLPFSKQNLLNATKEFCVRKNK